MPYFSLRTVLASLIVLLVALLVFLIRGDVETVQRITSEDHLVENLTVVAFMLGLFAAIYSLSQRRHMLISSVWMVLCIVFVGEETSWFQRAVGYSVPAIEQRNSQQEFNLHNLEFLHGSDSRKIISKEGSFRFGLSNLLTSQTLFRIGFFAYFLVLPLLLLTPLGRWLGERFNIPNFEPLHLLAFWALIALTIPITLMIDPERRLAIAECREFIYALAIAVYIGGFAFGTGAARKRA